MNFRARLIRPFGVSEALVSDYYKLEGILREGFSDIKIKQEGEADILSIDSESRDRAIKVFDELIYLYNNFSETIGRKERLILRYLF